MVSRFSPRPEGFVFESEPTFQEPQKKDAILVNAPNTAPVTGGRHNSGDVLTTQEINMRLMTLLVASTMFAVPAFAQKTQSTTNPNAVQIQGNTEIKADQKNVTAVAVGEGNTAKNTAGAIKGGTQIQGNTKIKASQKNATAVAVGKNNTAANEAGVIGGK